MSTEEFNPQKFIDAVHDIMRESELKSMLVGLSMEMSAGQAAGVLYGAHQSAVWAMLEVFKDDADFQAIKEAADSQMDIEAVLREVTGKAEQ